MKKVVIFQYRLLHYRLALFELLREQCARHDIDLYLVHGRATRREAARNDEGTLPWAHKVENRVWEVGERDIIWQPFPAALRDADLVIVMQENRILSNYPYLLKAYYGGPKVAFWRLGQISSNAPTGLREQWKRLMLTHVDWWFAYTEMTVRIVERGGYPKERITCLNNAIDNEAFRKGILAVVTDEPSRAATLEHGGSRIGLFCGSLYPEKRLDFMVEAADRIYAELPDFRLVVIGDGPSAGDILAARKSRPWMNYVDTQRSWKKPRISGWPA